MVSKGTGRKRVLIMIDHNDKKTIEALYKLRVEDELKYPFLEFSNIEETGQNIIESSMRDSIIVASCKVRERLEASLQEFQKDRYVNTIFVSHDLELEITPSKADTLADDFRCSIRFAFGFTNYV